MDGEHANDWRTSINSIASNFLSPLSYLETNDWGLFNLSANSAWVKFFSFRWEINISLSNILLVSFKLTEMIHLVCVSNIVYPILGYPILGFKG